MNINNAQPSEALGPVLAQLNEIVLDKDKQIKMALACLLARGHLLIEDLPGLGKTVLAHALGLTLGLKYRRVQFTSDLLPGDIIGCSIYDRNKGEFVFTDGPVFTQLLLSDEINRATPKCQSALLEAMEERQVSIDGKPRELPEPFFVIATQNPSEQVGTFPLPESQLDRFLMRISMGYANRDAELELFRGKDRRRLLEELKPIIEPSRLLGLQQAVGQVKLSDAVLDYLHRILEFTRNSELFQRGLSTRAGLGLLRAAQAWAFLHGEGKLLPGDIQAVLPAVAGHRLAPIASRMSAERIGEEIISKVGVE
ncbi:AAA family ATPase [Termitidicoccus mucosus]|uniref:AAA family ATPase n=1 Tax=Termitidicoccus mucosus TaxID=1184151 RepID=A0A178IL05_9BACT|nr:AAA family ATPase [Opitutaceae bacterium TSB47]